MKVAIMITGQPRFVDVTAPPAITMVNQLKEAGIDTDVFIHSWNSCSQQYLSKKSVQEINWQEEICNDVKSGNCIAPISEVYEYIQKRWQLHAENILVTDTSELDELHTDLINLELALSIPKKIENANGNFFETALTASGHRHRRSGAANTDTYFTPDTMQYRRNMFKGRFGQLFSFKHAVSQMLGSGKNYDLIIRIRHDALPNERFWITPELCKALLTDLVNLDDEYQLVKEMPNNLIDVDGVEHQFNGRKDSGVFLFPRITNNDAQRFTHFDIWSVSRMHSAICFTQKLNEDLLDAVSYASSLHHYDSYITNHHGMHQVWGLISSLTYCTMMPISDPDIPDLYSYDTLVRTDVD